MHILLQKMMVVDCLEDFFNTRRMLTSALKNSFLSWSVSEFRLGMRKSLMEYCFRFFWAFSAIPQVLKPFQLAQQGCLLLLLALLILIPQKSNREVANFLGHTRFCWILQHWFQGLRRREMFRKHQQVAHYVIERFAAGWCQPFFLASSTWAFHLTPFQSINLSVNQSVRQSIK